MPKTTAFHMHNYPVFLIAILGMLIVISCNSIHTHSNYLGDSVDVSKTRFARHLTKNIQSEVIDRGQYQDNALTTLKIQDSLPAGWARRFPNDAMENELVLKFHLYNSSDSVQNLYFFPGTYFSSIRFLKLGQDNTLNEISGDSTPPKWRKGFRHFNLLPKESAVYYARLRILRTSATSFLPQILQQDYIEPFVAQRVQNRATNNMLTYLATGIMLMTVLYSLAVYWQNRRKEFLYYCGYAGSMGILLFFKSHLHYQFTGFNFSFESYWDFLIQCAGVFCYFQFIRNFLNTKTSHGFLERVLRLGEILIGVFVTVYSALYFLTSEFMWLDFFENLTKQMLLVIGLIFIFYGIRKKDLLMRYMVAGNFVLIAGSILSFLQIKFSFQFTSNRAFSFFNEALFYYELGIVGELAFFLAGLAYKNRNETIRQTKEGERKELEKQMAVLAAQQDERERISADMHDELGSGVTAIRLMSEIVKTKMKESTLPEIDKISHSANDLITKMNTIIWTMSSSNDTVENLVTYIRTYAVEFFENTNIECRFNMPDSFQKIELSGERRRNIFLAVKEAMNNVLKHAKATEVRIDIQVKDKLIITIADNGLGIDMEKIRRFGNGLKNMQSRLENINGRFNIQNDQGTIALFEINLS